MNAMQDTKTGRFSGDDFPPQARPITTMWVQAIKTDQHGYLKRSKARLVALGYWKRPGVDFAVTLSPVARMASFKMALVLSAAIDLSVYGGYVNTAYLNAILTIPRYVKDNDGFPGKHKDHMCVVRKALYFLRQDGREWSDEFFK